jgi:hypothetical protein
MIVDGVYFRVEYLLVQNKKRSQHIRGFALMTAGGSVEYLLVQNKERSQQVRGFALMTAGGSVGWCMGAMLNCILGQVYR